jgi:hypothetical protein
VGETKAACKPDPGGSGGRGLVGEAKACPAAKTTIAVPKRMLRTFNEFETMSLRSWEI